MPLKIFSGTHILCSLNFQCYSVFSVSYSRSVSRIGGQPDLFLLEIKLSGSELRISPMPFEISKVKDKIYRGQNSNFYKYCYLDNTNIFLFMQKNNNLTHLRCIIKSYSGKKPSKVKEFCLWSDKLCTVDLNENCPTLLVL